MRIEFKRTGGFAGRRLSVSLDEPVPDELRRAIDEAHFFSLPPRLPSPPNYRDPMTYSITASDGEKTHTVTAGDGGIPEALQPLIDYLSRVAITQNTGR